jgi:hypothetical protein
MQLPISAVRLYVRAMERDSEIEDAIVDATPVEELLASGERLRRRFEDYTNGIDLDDDDADDDGVRAKVKAAVAVDPEYQYLKVELARGNCGSIRTIGWTSKAPTIRGGRNGSKLSTLGAG